LERHTPVYIYKVPQLTVHIRPKNQDMRSKELSVERRDRIVSRHRSGEGYHKMSAALKVLKNTVPSSFLNGRSLYIINNARGVWYMDNIPRLRAVLMLNATRSAWIQSLAVVYWPYTTNPEVSYYYYKLVTNLIRAVEVTVLSYPWYLV
jgi:hypothetical protein